MVGVGEAGDPFGRGREEHAVAGLAGANTKADGEVGLAGPGVEEDDVLFAGDEVQRAQVRDRRSLQRSGVVVVELLQALGAGNRAVRMRPSPPWASRAATSRWRQAARNSWCDQPSARARSASRPGASRSVGALSARRGMRARRSGHGWSWSAHRAAPSVRPKAVSESVRQRSSTSAGSPRVMLGCAARSRAAARAWSGSVIVWCLAQQRPWSATRRPSQTPARGPGPRSLDTAADHRRGDRVVVGVQAHVVVARQPQRGPPPGRRRDRWQLQHRGAVGVDPLRRRSRARGGDVGWPAAASHRAARCSPPGRRTCGRAETTSPDRRWRAPPGPWPPGRPHPGSRPWCPARRGRRARARSAP